MKDRTGELLTLYPPSENLSEAPKEAEQEDLFDFINEAYAILKAIQDGLEEDTCRELISTLKDFLENNTTSGSLTNWFGTLTGKGAGEDDKLREHRECVIWYLGHILDRRIISAQVEQQSKSHGGIKNRLRPAKPTFALPQIQGPAQYDDKALQASFEHTSQGHWKSLALEASQLSQRHSELSQAIESVESTLGTITRLQHLVLSELSWQEEKVKYLEGEASTTRDRVERGNRMIEKASSHGSSLKILSILILFFSFILLFLHYYST
jgi:hypothetical protein